MSTGVQEEGIAFDADLVVKNLNERNLHQRLIESRLSPEMKERDICDKAESLVEILNDIAGLNLTPEMIRNRTDVRNTVYSLLWKMGEEITEESAKENEDDGFDDGKKQIRPKYPRLVGKRILSVGIPEAEMSDNAKFVQNVRFALLSAEGMEKMFREAVEAPILLDRVFKVFARAEKKGENVLSRVVSQFCYVAFEGKNVVEIVDFIEKKMRSEAKRCGVEDLLDVVCKCVFGGIGEKLRMGAYDHFGDENRIALYKWALDLREKKSRLYELFGTALEYLITTNEPSGA